MAMSFVPSPPPSAAYPFIFTDESGVVVTSQTQPFYGIGMLKLSDAGRWYDGLNLLLDQFIASQAKAGVRQPRATYEFHFSKLTTATRSFYERLIDFFILQPDGYICSLVIDKNALGENPLTAYGTPWDALIKYSTMLVKRNVGTGEKAIIISDYYQKPRKSAKYYERELVAGLGVRVTNVLMMDSAASVMLQLVDVLLGCVMYHYKVPALPAVDADKKAVADRLAAAYGVSTLAGPLTKAQPNYFRVWPLKPNVSRVATGPLAGP
jgi:hypothetical protein